MKKSVVHERLEKHEKTEYKEIRRTSAKLIQSQVVRLSLYIRLFIWYDYENGSDAGIKM